MKNLITLFIIGLLIVGCSKDIGTGEQFNASSSSKSGSTASMLTYQGYLYFLDNSTIRTFSLADPAHPLETSQVKISAIAETIFAYENALYIDTRTGVLAYSLADKSKPVYQDNVMHWPAFDPVIIHGNYGYSTTRTGDNETNGSGLLTILDVTDRLNPFALSTISQEYPYGLGATDNYLYVCNGGFGINIFKINTDNGMLDFSSNLKTDPVYDCIISEELMICQMKSGIGIYDISAPEKPVLIQKISN